MCEHINMTDLIDMPEDGIARRKCGQTCAKCRARAANVYGAELLSVEAPMLSPVHQDVVSPAEQIFLREQIALQEGQLWLFD